MEIDGRGIWVREEKGERGWRWCSWEREEFWIHKNGLIGGKNWWY